MSEGGKWTPGKIILLILAILAGLCVVCGGLVYFVAGDKIMSGVKFGKDAAAFELRLQKDLGQKAAFDLQRNDRNEFILAVSAEGELTPERVTELQDKTWRAVGDEFGKDGFFPVKYVAIGRPGAMGARKGGHSSVVDWSANMVSVEEFVKRTGVPAPPTLAFLPDEIDGKVNVEFKGDNSEEEPKEDDGGKPGGK